MEKYILDTSAILSGKDMPMDRDLYVPPGVLDEIKEGGRWYKKLQRMKAAGLKVIAPSGSLIEEVNKKAKRTGDYLRLSDTDVEVVALAMYLDGVILTDDYSIQNISKEMHIPFEGIAQDEIEEEYTWRYRCRKCGRWYREETEICQTCGGEVRTVKVGTGDERPKR